MAFTYCTNCGEKIDDTVEKCPHCNHPKGVDRVYGYASESYGKKENTAENNGERQSQSGSPFENGNSGYGQEKKNPWENGDNRYGQNNNGYGQNNTYGQNGYGQNKNPWEGGSGYGQGGPWQSPYSAPWQPREKRKLSIGLIIFSIINILFGTCCAGSIFGIIGLVFAIIARDATTEMEEIRRKKISLTVNIIAVVLTVAFMISFGVAVWQGGGIEAIMMQ